MSRGTTLSTLRTYLKAELRESQDINSVIDTELNYRLANKQKDLANSHSWPFLEHVWDLSVPAGSRYLNLPTSDIRSLAVTPNFERPMIVERFYVESYIEIDYGIGGAEYTYLNGVDEPSDPIRRWQMVTNVNEASNPNQVEVWPVPSTAQVLRFTGQRQVLALTSDAHTADLDDLLLVYGVAAEYLALRGLSNAPLMLRRFQQRLLSCRGGNPVSSPPVVFGRNTLNTQEPVKLIAIA